VQDRGIEIPFLSGEVIVTQGFRDLRGCPDCTAIEVHQSSIRHGVRKDHTATLPIPCGMRPRARRGIAYAQLLRQGQGNAALLQIRCAAAARQSGLERHELRGQVGVGWPRLARCGRICGELHGCGGWLPGKPRWRLATVW
jgi:hypothetical protein